MSGLTIEQGRENDLLDRLAKAVSNSTKHDVVTKHSLREAIESIKHPEPPADKSDSFLERRNRVLDSWAKERDGSGGFYQRGFDFDPRHFNEAAKVFIGDTYSQDKASELTYETVYNLMIDSFVEGMERGNPCHTEPATMTASEFAKFDRVALAKEIMVAGHLSGHDLSKNVKIAFDIADEFIKQAQVTK